MSNTQVYSTDDEWFTYDELAAIICDNDLKAGDVIYTGESEPVKTLKLFDADDLVDMLADRMYDEVGECADGWPFTTKEINKEVNDELQKIIDKHFPQNFYRVVNVRQYEITDEDVKDAQ